MVSKPKVQEFFNFYCNNFSIPSTIYVTAKLTLIMAIRSLFLYGWWFTHHRLSPVQLTTKQTRSCGLLYAKIPTQTPLWQHLKSATHNTSSEFYWHHPQPLHFSTLAGHTQDVPQQTWWFYTHKMWYLLRMTHNGWITYRLWVTLINFVDCTNVCKALSIGECTAAQRHRNRCSITIWQVLASMYCCCITIHSTLLTLGRRFHVFVIENVCLLLGRNSF
jgi:hypothetical protein